MGEKTEVLLPDIGDFAEVEVIEVLVGEGDRIDVEDSLITLESDKATMEIPSPYTGVVRSLNVAVGDKINQGDLVLIMDRSETAEDQPDTATEAAPVDHVPAPAAEEKELALAPELAPEPEQEISATRLPGEKPVSTPPVPLRPIDQAPGRKAHASPAVRRFARELGVDLLQVAGSAPKGRVTKEDVQSFVKKSLGERVAGEPAAGLFELPAGPVVDFAKFGDVERKPLGRIQKISGPHLHRNWLTVPHVTQFEEADITELEAFRREQKTLAAKQEVRLTLFPFLLKACASALGEMPHFNASLAQDGEHLILKKYCHIGAAVDTPNGLVVPVIRDVDKKGIFELAEELGEVSDKARDGKLLPGDMQGGCFTISSLGGIGGTNFSPIVNAPEVAILGVSRSSLKPVWNGETFEPRLVLPFSLSYDHRVIDGAEGVRFTTYLAGLLSDIRRLLL